MCVAATARRRRAQASNHYRHIAPLRRPKFKLRDVDTSTKRLKRLVEKQKMMQQRKAFSKK
jgi:hypothetical protein